MAARHPVFGDTGGTSGGTQGWESLAEVPGLGWGAMGKQRVRSGRAALQAIAALCGVQESCLELGSVLVLGVTCFLRGILEPCPRWVYSTFSDH